MTRREYWILAEAILQTKLDDAVRDLLVQNICKAFAVDNDKFEPDHFLKVLRSRADGTEVKL